MSDLDFVVENDEPEREPEPKYVINNHRAEVIKRGIWEYQDGNWGPMVRTVTQSDDFFDLNVGQGATVALHGLRECGFSEATMRKVIGILNKELEEVAGAGKARCSICMGTGSDCRAYPVQGCECSQ